MERVIPNKPSPLRLDQLLERRVVPEGFEVDLGVEERPVPESLSNGPPQESHSVLFFAEDGRDAAHASGDPLLAGDGAKPDVAGRSEWQPPKSSPPARQRQHDLDENIVPLASVFGGRIVIVLLELDAEVRRVGEPCRGCRRVQVHLERA